MSWLKRLLLPLEKRSLTGLVLELVVVVCGIFLGLQADQWNDRRVENQLEAEYLHRLYTELVVGLEAQTADIELLTRRLGQHGTLIRWMEGADLSDPERDDVSTAVYALGKLNPVSGRFSVIDELQSTGRLALIRDDAIRADLGSLVRQFEQEQAIHELIADRVALALDRVTPHITYYNDPQRAELDPEAVGTESLQRAVREISHQTWEHRFTYQRQVTRTCRLVDRLAVVLGAPGTAPREFIELHGFVPACGSDA